MKNAYKKAVGLFTFLFVLGIAILAIGNFGAMRTMPINATLNIVGAITIALGLLVYTTFWRCPTCRELLPRQITVPSRCKNCNARLLDDQDEE